MDNKVIVAGKVYKVPVIQKDRDWSGLLKVPDQVIISELRQEVGRLTSYIQELEDKLTLRGPETLQKQLLELQSENTNLRNSLKQLGKNLSREQLDRKFAELKKENKSLRRQNGELIGKVVLLQEKLKLHER